MKVTIKQGDLSDELCDAIVNPTNTSMRHNGGLDTKIHQRMGEFFTSQVNALGSELQENACPVGDSRIFISKAQRDPNVARFVINTVGPRYRREGKDLASFHLKSCYSTSLALANSYGLSSIAYPAISCGAFHFPPNEAAQVGIETIRTHSYQVTDVRFVLYERHIYEAFVQEWIDYSNKINRQANVIDDRDRPLTPPPVIQPRIKTTVSTRLCTFCKEQQLLVDQEHLCTQCSGFTRSEVFSRLLQQLCFAAEKSFDALKDKCNVLKPILSYYPLNYAPAQVFDQSIHKRDLIAENYLQSNCDRRFRHGKMPMAVLGDGNCFYNTFVKLGGVGTTTEATTVTPQELRARNVIELTLNVEEYKQKYSTFEAILEPFQQYVRDEMVHDANYVSVWDFFSIPTVLNIKVTSIYPYVNGKEDLFYQTINGKDFEPLTNNQSTSTSEVKILFSHCNRPAHLGPNAKEKAWLPNHFVPVLNLS